MFKVHKFISQYYFSSAENYPNVVSKEEIGLSFEGRPLVVAKICYKGCGRKPIMWIDGGILTFTCNVENQRKYIIFSSGIHAREWISPASVMYMVNTLAREMSHEDSALIFKLDWFVNCQVKCTRIL